ncbi:MAG: hypothetical protein ACD_7C00182G0001 [uncultured bacterium]|nr:MAG: hypothetical protein ACD_7C00182G0001 [uncultured bacterium]
MNTTIKPLIPVNTQEIARKGEEIYQKELKEKLEKEYFGKFVAIEVEYGEYFLGETQMEADIKAKNKYPGKIFYTVKIGFPAVITMSRNYSPVSYEGIF